MTAPADSVRREKIYPPDEFKSLSIRGRDISSLKSPSQTLRRDGCLRLKGLIIKEIQ